MRWRQLQEFRESLTNISETHAANTWSWKNCFGLSLSARRLYSTHGMNDDKEQNKENKTTTKIERHIQVSYSERHKQCTYWMVHKTERHKIVCELYSECGTQNRSHKIVCQWSVFRMWYRKQTATRSRYTNSLALHTVVVVQSTVLTAAPSDGIDLYKLRYTFRHGHATTWCTLCCYWRPQTVTKVTTERLVV